MKLYLQKQVKSWVGTWKKWDSEPQLGRKSSRPRKRQLQRLRRDFALNSFSKSSKEATVEAVQWVRGWWWPAAGLGTLSIAVSAWDILKEITVIFITSTMVWPWVDNREGTQPHLLTENWIKDLLSMAPPIRTRPSFPLSQSLPSRSFHKPLNLLHQKVDRLKTTVTED